MNIHRIALAVMLQIGSATETRSKGLINGQLNVEHIHRPITIDITRCRCKRGRASFYPPIDGAVARAVPSRSYLGAPYESPAPPAGEAGCKLKLNELTEFHRPGVAATNLGSAFMQPFIVVSEEEVEQVYGAGS